VEFCFDKVWSLPHIKITHPTLYSLIIPLPGESNLHFHLAAMPRNMLKQVLRRCLFIVCLPAKPASRIFDCLYYNEDSDGASKRRQSRSDEALLNGQFEKTHRSRHSSPIRDSILDIIKPIYFLKLWNREPQKLRPTAWLDGLRGVAALIVTIYHFAHFWPWMVRGWGASETDYHWLQFYFVRLIISGGFMVRIFFVISGKSTGF
jgi:hypothetical protein